MYKIIFLFVFILLFNSCTGSLEEGIYIQGDTLSYKQTQDMREYEAIKLLDTFPLIKYNHIKIEDWDHRQQIVKEFSYDGNNWAKNKTFRTLNREQLNSLRPGEVLAIPDSFILDQRAYSIFPAFYWGARFIPKIIIVSNAFQAYACYEFGKLVRFAPTNTGKESTQTYPGRYSVYWRVLDHQSSLDSNWHMPYTINFHKQAGNAFHQFSMPGRPVSHSCCRQFMEDAKWLFYWVDLAKIKKREFIPFTGTPVLIIDYFDFSRKRGGPWLELMSNKDTILNLPDDPMNYEVALIPICQIPPGGRWDLPGGKARYDHAEDTLRARGVIREHVKLIETRNFNEERRKKKALEEKKKKEAEKNNN